MCIMLLRFNVIGRLNETTHVVVVFFWQGSVNFKFGILYAKQGQTTDDEVFSNGKDSVVKLVKQWKIFQTWISIILVWQFICSRSVCHPYHFFVCVSHSKWIISSVKIESILLLHTPSQNNLLNLFTVNVSDEFQHFLELMGDKIELKGWQKYRGGLDVKSKIKFSRAFH